MTGRRLENWEYMTYKSRFQARALVTLSVLWLPGCSEYRPMTSAWQLLHLNPSIPGRAIENASAIKRKRDLYNKYNLSSPANNKRANMYSPVATRRWISWSDSFHSAKYEFKVRIQVQLSLTPSLKLNGIYYASPYQASKSPLLKLFVNWNR